MLMSTIVRNCSRLAPALLITASDWLTARMWVAWSSASRAANSAAFKAVRRRACCSLMASIARAAMAGLSTGAAIAVWATRHPSGTSGSAMRSRVTSKNARTARSGSADAPESACSYLSPYRTA